jgi:predicted DNA-binding transcriptional regulator YafY
MRDIDALTEAGLPIVVHRGSAGGVELGFNYRSRFVGLDANEAEALGVIFAVPNSALTELEIVSAAHTARDKLLESLPELVRKRVRQAQRRFQFSAGPPYHTDARVAALAAAIRDSAITRIQAKSRTPRIIHPIALRCGPLGWAVVDANKPDDPIPIDEVGDINISARRFSAYGDMEPRT